VSNTHELTTTRAALVVNTGSRTGRRAFQQARGRLIELGVPLASVHPVHDAAELPDAVAAAVTDGCDLVVLGGGDGTISASVGGLIGTKAVLGVLPLGTANDFARTLEIPNDLDGACEAIANGQVVDVDLGIADDHYFVNVASLGMSVAVTHALTPGLKRRSGSLAYPWRPCVPTAATSRSTAVLEFPAGDHPIVSVDRALQVAVGNGRYYGGGNVLSPDAGHRRPQPRRLRHRAGRVPRPSGDRLVVPLRVVRRAPAGHPRPDQEVLVRTSPDPAHQRRRRGLEVHSGALPDGRERAARRRPTRVGRGADGQPAA
jgi:diacylglycerol kinase family enzyme